MQKLMLVMALILLTLTSVRCQPKDDYEIFSNQVTDATKYHFFLEKKSSGPYQLVEGMDYLSPDVTQFKVGESNISVFTVNLNNDGAEYKVGVVAEDAAGFYGGMGTAIGIVGKSPAIPGNTGLRKKL